MTIRPLHPKRVQAVTPSSIQPMRQSFEYSVCCAIVIDPMVTFYCTVGGLLNVGTNTCPIVKQCGRN